MVGIDIIGTENVLKYIEASKFTKFTIDANKSGHFICVFECINSQSNEMALNEFAKWADFINQNQTYRITLFDLVETVEDNGILKTKKTKNKTNKMACTFILNESYNVKSNTQQIVGAVDEEAIMKRLTSKIIEEQNSNAILNEIRNLSERLTKMELEEVEEEEEEEATQNGLGALGSNQVEQIMGLINLFKNNTKPQINGDIETQNDFKTNINKALKILHKNNPQLDTDLLKLAELSETKKETFKMLITTLRNM